MSENENGQERTEAPTPKRRRDAREKGQVARSRELNTTLVMLAAVGGLLLLGGFMARELENLLAGSFQIDRALIFDPGGTLGCLRAALLQGIWTVAPFTVLMLIVAMMAPLALGGWSFSTQAMAPKLERLNPLKGFKRVCGPHGLMELAKALVKVLIVGITGTLMAWLALDDLQTLAAEALRPGLRHAAELLFGTFAALAGSLLLIAAVDVPFQLWNHTRQLRMTVQEIKDEMKDTEGKPEVKSRIRQLQQELAQGRMMEQVPKADVIVTNPTHYAVALKYDQIHMRAPRVIAKGTDLVARRIRDLARENRVPLFEAPPLARVLYNTTELGKEVPAGLYLAVAQVLAYIYQLRGRRAGLGKPSRPQPEIPEEFLKYVQQE